MTTPARRSVEVPLRGSISAISDRSIGQRAIPRSIPRMIDRNAIAAVLFRPVERLVGAAQERGGGVPGAFGKSGRNRDGNGMAARRHGNAIARNRHADSFRDLKSPTQTGAGHDNDEFVAAKPEQKIGFADDLFRASGEAFQNAISGVVPMPVVDRFETVEIENHRAQWASARPIEKRAKMGIEATAIFQSGQRVNRRHFDRGFDIVAQTVGISLPPDLGAHASGKFVAIDLRT